MSRVSIRLGPTPRNRTLSTPLQTIPSSAAGDLEPHTTEVAACYTPPPACTGSVLGVLHTSPLAEARQLVSLNTRINLAVVPHTS